MANSDKIKLGPGTLYVAKLGTAEPTSISGAWPSGWHQLGYTDAGSQFDYAPSFEPVEVEEELLPVLYTPTGATAAMTFALAEQTANNLLIALNAGTVDDRVSAATGTFTDGTWVEPVVLGSEKRIMVGWDALDYNLAGDAFGRLIARKCLQVGTISRTRRKGNNKATFPCTFNLEKPTGVAPFRDFYPTSLAS